MMKKYLFLFFAMGTLLVQPSVCQVITSGPMPGYKTMTEVAIWLQTDTACTVQIEYSKEGDVLLRTKSRPIECIHENAYTAQLTIEGLEPGTAYTYQVLINDKVVSDKKPLQFSTQVLWQYRSDPPAFKVALGSCTYVNEKPYDRPGKDYGDGYGIFDQIVEQKPDMMLWLGDNIYLREVDWSSRSGYLHRYTHTRSLAEMQNLLQSTHHYAIWDDHDFGPNDANGSWIYKDWALESFDLFWANPTTGISGLNGITTAFQFNDVDFFLLDNRYHRTPDQMNNGEIYILGEEQIEWLIQILKYSRAPFKMVAVGGQVLNTAAVYETHSVYAEERKLLLRRIVEEEIKGVVFLTGDRHHTELTKYEAENGIVIYDLTVSPLLSGTHADDGEDNKLRVENTLVNKRNFGILSFSGPRKSREMKISIFDTSGAIEWEKTINQFTK